MAVSGTPSGTPATGSEDACDLSVPPAQCSGSTGQGGSSDGGAGKSLEEPQATPTSGAGGQGCG